VPLLGFDHCLERELTYSDIFLSIHIHIVQINIIILFIYFVKTGMRAGNIAQGRDEWGNG
jgi:hypothetical protein